MNCSPPTAIWRLLISRWSWVSLILVMVFVAVVRIRMLDVPLERDEGEYAYMGRLMLEGVPPYKEAYNMKMPGIYAAYALIMAVLGQTRAGIHTGLLLVNLATILLLYLLARRQAGNAAAVMTAGAYGVMSLSSVVQGVFAHSEHFVMLFAVAGILVLLKSMESEKRRYLFWSGILFGTAFLMKQHGGIFAVWGMACILYQAARRRPFVWKGLFMSSLLFVLGVIVPVAVTFAALWAAGVFSTFWQWTFTYARSYVALVPFNLGLEYLTQELEYILPCYGPLWALVLVGLFALLRNRNPHTNRFAVLALTLCSLAATSAGLYFRPHYFVLSLPALALLAGLAAEAIAGLLSRARWRRLSQTVFAAVCAVCVAWPIGVETEYLFKLDSEGVSRMVYGCQPFVESVKIAGYIKEHTSQNDRIAVMGSEPQIYFYSNRRSASGFIYIYSLMEAQPLALVFQQKMIKEIESARPAFIVLVHCESSWVVFPYSPKLLTDWLEKYLQQYYILDGGVDMLSPQRIIYKWAPEVWSYRPRALNWIAIYKRR